MKFLQSKLWRGFEPFIPWLVVVVLAFSMYENFQLRKRLATQLIELKEPAERLLQRNDQMNNDAYRLLHNLDQAGDALDLCRSLLTECQHAKNDLLRYGSPFEKQQRMDIHRQELPLQEQGPRGDCGGRPELPHVLVDEILGLPERGSD